jgi:hypothetical protein
MNALTRSEAAIESDRDCGHVRTRSADPVPGSESFNEPKEPPNTVRPALPDDAAFASFLGGAGI